MFTAIARICGVALSLHLVAACAPLPMADAASAAQAKTFTPGSNQANVYIYRNEYLGGGVRMAITVDGKEAGITRGKTYLLLRLDPGKRTIISQGQANSAVTLDVAPGKNYFIWQEVTHNFFSFTYHSRLKLVDETKGRAGVNECELVAATQ